MFYKPNLGETLARLGEFWMRRMTGEITAIVRGFPNPYFQQFLDSRRLEPEGSEAADIPDDELRWAHWDAKLRICGEVRDDSLPVAYPARSRFCCSTARTSGRQQATYR